MADGPATISESRTPGEAPEARGLVQHSTVERCDVLQHRNEIVSLFQREGKAHIADRFGWYYGNQGQQSPISWVLRNGEGKICGLCSVTLRTLRYGDRVLKAGVAGDLLMDRTKGMYMGAFSLVRAAMSLVAKGEIDILLGSPNELARPVFERLGFRLIDVWETRAMIYRSLLLLKARYGLLGALASPIVDAGAATRRLLSRHSATGRNAFRVVRMRDCQLDDLRMETWEVPPERFVACRSTEYLLWRFVRDPVTPCDVMGLFAQSGEPCGYVVRRCAFNRISVTDCAADRRRLSDAVAIACLCRELESRSTSVWVTTLRSSPLSRELSSAGFMTLRPSKNAFTSPLVGLWLSEHPLSTAFARPAAWSLFPGFNDV